MVSSGPTIFLEESSAGLLGERDTGGGGEWLAADLFFP